MRVYVEETRPHYPFPDSEPHASVTTRLGLLAVLLPLGAPPSPGADPCPNCMWDSS